MRRLINHIVGGSQWFAITTNAGAAPDVDDTEDTDYTAGDMLASYDKGISESLAAFGAPGAEEKMVKLPFGEYPGTVFMAFATIDHFTHGWDLAKATGQPTDLDSEMALQLLDQARMMVPDQFRARRRGTVRSDRRRARVGTRRRPTGRLPRTHAVVLDNDGVADHLLTHRDPGSRVGRGGAPCRHTSVSRREYAAPTRRSRTDRLWTSMVRRTGSTNPFGGSVASLGALWRAPNTG